MGKHLSILLLVSFGACSAGVGSFAPLLNQGILPVSDENPYTGPNLFLAKEMERSIYLYNFIRDKGSPSAIELQGSGARDVETHLFYSSPVEEYVAKPAPTRPKVGESTREWIIIGPFSLNRERYRVVQKLQGSRGGVFELFGKREVIGRGPAVSAPQEELRPVFLPTPAPPKKPARKGSKQAPKAKVGRDSAEGTEAPTTLNFDQQALKEARDYAPRDTNGDVIHTVSKRNETLQSIAQWYTARAENSSEIAKRNKLSNDARLKPGEKIFIPSSLITNPKKME